MKLTTLNQSKMMLNSEPKKLTFPCKDCKWDTYSKQVDEVYIDKHCSYCFEPHMKGYTPITKNLKAKQNE